MMCLSVEYFQSKELGNPRFLYTPDKCFARLFVFFRKSDQKRTMCSVSLCVRTVWWTVAVSVTVRVLRELSVVRCLLLSVQTICSFSLKPTRSMRVICQVKYCYFLLFHLALLHWGSNCICATSCQNPSSLLILLQWSLQNVIICVIKWSVARSGTTNCPNMWPKTCCRCLVWILWKWNLCPVCRCFHLEMHAVFYAFALRTYLSKICLSVLISIII